MGATILWVIPENKGGIRFYADSISSGMKEACRHQGDTFNTWTGPLKTRSDIQTFFKDLKEIRPDLVHVQHEFGLFGSKTPFFCTFPNWVSRLRKVWPEARIIATAHNVLSSEYSYPIAGRGWQAPLRALANLSVLPYLRRHWTVGTWGVLDGVIVHSKYQRATILESGCGRVEVIPHFVFPEKTLHAAVCEERVVLVFGYFCFDKAQDVAIRAFARLLNHMSPDQAGLARLILAGGVRREADRPYFESCKKLISDLGISGQVTVTGYVPDSEIDSYYERATLVLAPFRETSGSGSLAQAFSRSAAILASDLALNSEISEREPGSLEFFKTEDPEDCADKIRALILDPARLQRLRAASHRYAAANSPEVTVERHLAFYRALLASHR